MKKHILCLGDSNTHGYCADPNDCADHGIRFNEDERWDLPPAKGTGRGVSGHRGGAFRPHYRVRGPAA